METIIGSVISTVVGKAAQSWFGEKSEAAAPPPTVAPPVEMPDPLAAKSKARRKTALSMSRQLSAANTVLTGGDTKLGA